MRWSMGAADFFFYFLAVPIQAEHLHFADWEYHRLLSTEVEHGETKIQANVVIKVRGVAWLSVGYRQ